MKLEQRPTELEQHIDEAEESEGNLLKYNETWKPHFYQFALDIRAKHEQSHWTEDEIDLSDDVSQWKGNQLTDVEKSHILNILRLFTQSDVAVGQVYCDYFIPKFKNTDVRNMLTSFAAREAVHMHAYSLLNDSLGLPEEEYHAFLEYSVMKEKIEFMTEADVSTYRGLALALAKAVFNEGLTLFASFVMLLNYERQGKMKGMGLIASWSLVDESVHVEGVSELFRAFCAEHPRIVDDEFKKAIYDIAREVIALEDRFITKAYELGEVEGMSSDEVRRYIRYVADRRLQQLGLKENWHVKENPIKWLDWVTGDRHASFFETRVTEYDSTLGGSLRGDWEYQEFGNAE